MSILGTDFQKTTLHIFRTTFNKDSMFTNKEMDKLRKSVLAQFDVLKALLKRMTISKSL